MLRPVNAFVKVPTAVTTLEGDASSLTVSGTPAAADAGPHELLLLAADSNGAAAYGSLTISVGAEGVVPNGGATVPQAETAPVPQPAPPANVFAATDLPEPIMPISVTGRSRELRLSIMAG